MFEYIGVDWGEKYCGLAFGDINTGLIIPSTQEISTLEIINTLGLEVQKRKSKYIIIGLPLNFHGEPTKITKLVEKFTQEVITLFPGCDIFNINERGTTIDSKQKLDKYYKYQLDNQAAAEIIKLFFFKQNPKKT